jgi:hypothetical protein
MQNSNQSTGTQIPKHGISRVTNEYTLAGSVNIAES